MPQRPPRTVLQDRPDFTAWRCATPTFRIVRSGCWEAYSECFGSAARPVAIAPRPGDAGRNPQVRLTHKVKGKTVAESFRASAPRRKAQAEIGEVHRLQKLNAELIEVHEKISPRLQHLFVGCGVVEPACQTALRSCQLNRSLKTTGWLAGRPLAPVFHVAHPCTVS